MRYVRHRLFWVWDFDREEKWLNEMAAKGLQLTAVGFCTYTFEEGGPGEYDIRLELLEHSPACAESAAYIRFIEETGAEYLGSVCRWAYFRKKKSEGCFDLFSDIDSRIKHLNRIMLLILLVGLCELFTGVGNSFNIYSRIRSPENLVLFVLCSSLFLLIVYGFFRILAKIRRLQKERKLHE